MVEDLVVKKNPFPEKRKQKTSKRGKGKNFKQRKDSFQEIAKSRIDGLFIQAENVFNEDATLAKRYITLAKTISLKFKVPFNKGQKTKYCKVCNSFLKQGVNARLRLSKGNLVIKCLSCNAIRRFKVK